MDPARWSQLERLCDDAVALSAEERRRYIDTATAGDPELRRQLEDLLAHTAPNPLLEGIVQRMRDTVEQPPMTGLRIGPFRIVREIGRGGMGAVFEAEREGEFRQTVALKVCGQAPFSPGFRARFEQERQILASLRHPNIVQLHDGGATPEGVPYFAMELVEGRPIHDYCIANRLSLDGRIGLFLEVCGAVEHAHQRLIVHRDLKPSNILVNAAGHAKVLDFGIAKALDPDAMPGFETRTVSAPVTPDYCSPEQLLGQPVTTRTDVFQLGLILFELLTGQRARQMNAANPTELAKAVCQDELPLASVAGANNALAGDLDTIVATATHKDPERRYAGVGALARDLAHYQSHLPIAARRDSAPYRLRKFLARNRLASAAAAAVLLTLLGGVAATTYQARRSARRFEQVRGIARALMFDVHDAIENLPGALEARNTVVRTALRYLDALSTEAAGDEALQLELASGYSRVAEIQSGMTGPNLGLREEAIQNLRKAQAILEPLYRAHPESKGPAMELADVHRWLSEIAVRTGDRTAGHRHMEESLAISQQLAKARPADAEVAMDLALGYFQYNRDIAPRGTPDFRYVAEPIRLIEELLRRSPNDPRLLRELARAYNGAGSVYFSARRAAEALPYLEKAAALTEDWVRGRPGDATSRRNLMYNYSGVGDIYFGYSFSLGNREKASAAFAKMAEHSAALLAADPNRSSVRVDYAMAQMRQATAMPPKSTAAIELMTKALATIEAVRAADPNNNAVVSQIGPFYSRLAARHMELGQYDRGAAFLRRYIAMAEGAAERDPNDSFHRSWLLSTYERLADELLRRQDTAGLRDLAARAQRRMNEHRALDPSGALKDIYAKTEAWMAKARAGR
ncbi:MAG: protein kinase [Bryobacterales bacterium]|nr:protein kinase [Bryobacterales bacterium]